MMRPKIHLHDSNEHAVQHPLSRRDALRWISSVAAAAPIATLLGCDDDDALAEDSSLTEGGAGGTAGSAGSSDSAGSGGADAEAAAGSGGSSEEAGAGGAAGESTTGSSTEWASGGTAALHPDTYPNPFTAETATSCSLFCQATLGPCHDDQAPEREDISEGQPGLPMRFALRILDDACQPVTDADVDIWHCDVRGIYSSETSDNPGYCTGDDAEALAARYFRGHTMTDSEGIAWFNTCFPGWYASRAIHIHFTVRRSSREGDEYLTSQIGFQTDLIQDVCTTHTDYVDHGLPDTANDQDNVFPADSVDDYLVETERMSDGALLAWKTLIIRSSLSDAVCGTSGGGGGGGSMPTGGGPGGAAPSGTSTAS